jgi:uncharacterized protein YbjT (DUF2867 family)
MVSAIGGRAPYRLHHVAGRASPAIRASVEAARATGVRHLVYVSVAHPAPVMRAYIAVRQEGERLIRASGLAATILRPWYVLGPGHRWPYLLLLRYWAACRGLARALGGWGWSLMSRCFGRCSG